MCWHCFLRKWVGALNSLWFKNTTTSGDEENETANKNKNKEKNITSNSKNGNLLLFISANQG